MGPILVVGATGHLGGEVAARLRAAGRPVRAFVRKSSDSERLKEIGAELALGDLRDEQSVAEACRGASAVIATANSVVPRVRGDTYRNVEGEGYRRLLKSSFQHGIGRFVMISVATVPQEHKVPNFHYRRVIEQEIVASGLEYTIVQATPFMDVWLSLIGSAIPVRGTRGQVGAKRPFWVAQGVVKTYGTWIEDRGLAVIPGNGKTRHSFVAVDDVASLLVAVVTDRRAANQVYQFGGPEELSWDEVVATYARVLKRPVRAIHVPASLYRLGCWLAKPLSEEVANTMGASWIHASSPCVCESSQLARDFGVTQTTVEEFLSRKAQLAA